ncbi:hypothetical protein [Alkaliphilus oremlandii]|uniref:Uncharacterized protein n=1 Tax=Alkaliphilus oremlandii (strain OhILAs) TaxID=350688 RepID=A8MHT1_ALKOO|nr:hypothetical protein [Alkaliphilus oremlandii]ABW19363.1 hypothetical protein Clos_1823 [Alkaliphilus oremlandii OhILAs]
MKSKRILIISMMFILLFTSFSFAVDYSKTKIPSSFSSYSVQHFIIYQNSKGKVCVLLSDGRMTIDPSSNKIFTSGTKIGNYFVNDDLSVQKSGYIADSGSPSWAEGQLNYSNYMYTNYDVKNLSGTVFFSKTLGPILEEMVTTDGMMMTVRQVVGLIPYVIGFLIIYLAFSKAWQFLLKLLRMA